MDTKGCESYLVPVEQVSVIGRFSNEEMDSNIGYPLGFLPRSITEQVSILRWYFPSLGIADDRLSQGTLPLGAEGWFAIPKWQKLARSYNEAVELVIGLISEVHGKKFSNHRDGYLGPKNLQQTKMSHDATARLLAEQKDFDILVVPAQFGLRHRGRSVRRSRAVFSANEFGLGVFAVSIMLLTHPDRFINNSDLWVECSGDEYARSDSPSEFIYAPFFGFCDGVLWFGADWIDFPSADYGSASGFIP